MIIDLEKFTQLNHSGFLVLDGLNGSGKSTLQKKIAQYLESQGHKVLTSREPGSSPIGKSVREILLSSELAVDPISEVLLFNADRREHIEKMIKPALSKNTKVITDRFYYSTLAFQGYGRGIDLNLLLNINKIVVEKFPDLVIILDVDPERGLKRTKGREEEDKFEKEKLDFQLRLKEGFLDLATKLPEHFLIIDANQTADAVWNDCKPWIDAWISKCQ